MRSVALIDIMGLLCSRQKRFSEADTEENVQVESLHCVYILPFCIWYLTLVITKEFCVC